MVGLDDRFDLAEMRPAVAMIARRFDLGVKPEPGLSVYCGKMDWLWLFMAYSAKVIRCRKAVSEPADC
jgi:hypothetical protein